MKFARDLSLVLGTAVLTALLAGPLLGPVTAGAVDDEAAPTAPAAKPVLSTGSFQLSLTLDQKSYEPGQTPVVLFEAVNGGEETAEVEAWVRMKTLDREMTRSRMPPLPREQFSRPITLKLAPGETKRLELPVGVKLTAGSLSTFEIESGDKQILATSVTVPVPKSVGSVLRPVRLAYPAQQESVEETEILVEEPVIQDEEILEEEIVEEIEVAPTK